METNWTDQNMSKDQKYAYELCKHDGKIECKKHRCGFLVCMYIIYIPCINHPLAWSMALVSVVFKIRVWKEKQLVASFTSLIAVNDQ